MADHLSLQAVASELDLHYMTIYRYVRLGLLPASKAGGKWQVRRADLEQFRARGDQGDEVMRGPADSQLTRADWSGRYEVRLIAGDHVGAWSVIEAAMVAGHSRTDVYLQIMTSSMYSLGERWHTNAADIAEERQATAIVRRHIGRLSPHFVRRGRSRGSVVLGCLPGERHDTGIAMVADLLRASGYDVIELGADVHVDAFVHMAEQQSRLVAVGLSAYHRDSLQAADELAMELRQLPSRPLVVVGGNVVENLDSAPSGNYVISDALSIAQLIDAHRLERRSPSASMD
ncbi:MAG: cobalamin-dependent protein [Acidimicrobiales bacterium]